MRGRRQRGISLAEALVVLGLLGMTVVALAPFETMLLRAIRDAAPAGAASALSVPARRLAADARTAVESRIVSPAEARFTLADGRTVTWKRAGAGVVRDDGATRQRLDGWSLDVSRRGALLDATLARRGGTTHRVEIFLRHREGER